MGGDPIWALLAAAQDFGEEIIGLVFEEVAGLSHAEPGGIEVVLAAGDAECILSGMLSDEVGELLVEGGDVFIGQGWGLAVAFEDVSEVFEFFLPGERFVEGQCDVLSYLGGFVCVDVSGAIGLVGGFGIEGFRPSNGGHRRQSALLDVHDNLVGKAGTDGK